MPSWMMTIDRSDRHQLVSRSGLTRCRDGLYPVPGTISSRTASASPRKSNTPSSALDRIRPYTEFAGGPFWTDLAGKIPEESSQFNFILTAGFGVSYFLTDQAALNVGYRFQHISNGGTQLPEPWTQCQPALWRLFILFLNRGGAG